MSILDNLTLPRYTELFKIFVKYYIIIIVVCIIFYILYKYIYLPISNNLFKKQNTFGDNIPFKQPVINKNEQLQLKKERGQNGKNTKINNTLATNKKKTIFYLFWTGGYDSTFRLCEMLINENKIVQPLYISFPLDNDCVIEKTCNTKWVRRNRKQEKIAMLKIRQKLFTKFPKTKVLLLPTIYIDKDIEDDKFNENFEKKFYKDNLWPKKRKIHQYLFLSKFAYYHKQHIDIGVLGIHKNSKFAKFLNDNLTKTVSTNNNSKTVNKIINYKIKDPKHFLYYINFPLYNRTKKELLLKGKNSNYADILKMSWSCWFPNPKTGKSCGKCTMCKERIISHPTK